MFLLPFLQRISDKIAFYINFCINCTMEQRIFVFYNHTLREGSTVKVNREMF